MGRELDKKEATFYGRFVLAAYEMFKHPQGRDPLRPEPAGIPDPYELEAWIHMSDFILDAEVPKFYGIVAHHRDKPGLRIIAIRGTEGAVEWLDDAAAIPVPFHQVPSAGRVAYGFDRIYGTLKVVRRIMPGVAVREAAAMPETFSGSFAEQLEQLAIGREAESLPARQLAEGSVRPKRPTTVAAHSLGAALATLFVMENDARRKFDIATLCTFASPRVGNLEFVHVFNKLGIDSWRIVSRWDVVPKLPPHFPILLDYGHVNDAYRFDSSQFARNSLLCWHTMETYLHWLDSSFPLLKECVP